MNSEFEGNSNIVTTNQDGIHENLEDIVTKYTFENYLRPPAKFSEDVWSEILNWIGSDEVVFDLGCGIGASCIYLAKKYPTLKIVGIDKSISRLNRKNDFKNNLDKRIKLFRGELLDLIPLIYKNSTIKIHSIYLLYPNPYPKKIHVKKRFHGNPICVFLFNIKAPIILRSNWKLYLEEFAFVGKIFQKKSVLEVIESPELITPFEEKFFKSGQELFELRLS
jgi:tRNA (guanine-N7-)-methyltransferase